MAATAEQLPNLDPDDSRTPSLQIASVLRTAINDGVYAPGDRLPGQEDLASRYRVARETIKSAIRRLSNEGLTASRQGSGVYVLAQNASAPGAEEVTAVRRELEALRAQLRKTNTDIKLAEGRIDALLTAWEVHETQSTANEPHPQ